MYVDCEESGRMLMVLNMKTGFALHSADLLETVTNFLPCRLETLCACNMEYEAWHQD